MRVSIWQQFSSNHSNDFIIVGQFANEDAAYAAYFNLRRVMRRLIERYKTETVLRESLAEEPNLYQATQIEIEVFKPFGIIPNTMIDWLSHREMSEAMLPKAITLYDSHVYVTNPIWGYAGVEPFDQLLKASGGTVYSAEAEANDILFAIDITCSAPDEKIAQSIYQALHNIEHTPIAWLEYHSGIHRIDALHLKEHENAYLAWKTWIENIEDLQARFRRSPRWQRPDLSLSIQQAQRQRPSAAKLTEDDRQEIHHLREQVSFLRNYAHIGHSGRVIHCSTLAFRYNHTGYALPAILEWMKSQGCSVNYLFKRLTFQT